MKNHLILIIIFIFSFESVLAIDKYDAEYLTYETEETISRESGKKFNAFIREVKVHRKIRILSPNGLERFNRLYIPTYEDLDFRSIVYELNAKTIKPNGDEYKVNKDQIKETTLPGNNPFLRKYEGSVKLVALPQVDVGDIIEYTYTIKYVNDFSSDYTDAFERVFMEDIPIRTFEQVFIIDNKLHARVLEFNLSSKCTEEERDKFTVYTWSSIDIEAFKDEVYSHEYDFLPHISLLVSTGYWTMSSSWNTVMRQIDTKPKGRYNFISEFSINELKRLADEKETVEQKVRLVCDSLYEWKRDKDEDSYYNKYSRGANWYVNNKYLTLFKKLGIKVSLVLLRPLDEGPFDEDLISLSQFTTALIEFEDEIGGLHYLTPRKAFTHIDHIPFDCQGSRAVRIRDLLSNSEVEVFTLPYQTEESQIYEDKRRMKISEMEDSLVYEMDVTRYVKGDPDYIYMACFNNKVDSTMHKMAALDLDETIFNRESVAIENSEWTTKVKDYYTGEVEVSTFCIAKEKKDVLQNNMPLWRLLDSQGFDNWLSYLNKGQIRNTDAHISSAYSASTSITLMPSENYRPQINELMNLEFSNDYGSINCSAAMDGEDLKIDISIKFKKGFVPKDDWEEFVNFDRKVNNLILLEIPLLTN